MCVKSNYVTFHMFKFSHKKIKYSVLCQHLDASIDDLCTEPIKITVHFVDDEYESI